MTLKGGKKNKKSNNIAELDYKNKQYRHTKRQIKIERKFISDIFISLLEAAIVLRDDGGPVSAAPATGATGRKNTTLLSVLIKQQNLSISRSLPTSQGDYSPAHFSPL